MKNFNVKMLFNACCLSLIVTAMTFAIRAKLMPVFEEQFDLTKEELGWVAGTAFWGFTLAMIFGGTLVDIIGMKRILGIAFAGHLIGVVVTTFATGFWTLYSGTLAIGIANGMIEAACNPLVATIHNRDKTKMLNRFHLWFPGGIVIGGLISYLFIDLLDLRWELLMGLLVVPSFIYGIMFLKLKIPVTERVAQGVSTKKMFKACLSPLFLFILFCMLLTASTELGTGQWIEALLGNTGVPAIILLVFINGIMAIGRLFAGPVVHRLNTTGVLVFSAVFSAIGLLLLSHTSGYMSFAAAAIFAAGVCYFWPTILGFVSENIPKSGALGLSITGGMGMLSVAVVLPYIGKIFDFQKKKALQEGLDQTQAELYAGTNTLEYVAILPMVLILCFTALYYYQKSQRYKNVIDK